MRLRCALSLLAVVAALATVAPPAGAAEPSTFVWDEPFQLTPLPPGELAFPTLFLRSNLSCGTPTLCVAAAADQEGTVLTTTDPARGDAWTPGFIPGLKAPTAIHCVGDAFCLLGDEQGKLSVTTDPAAPHPTWSTDTIASSDVADISCPSVALCVAVDSDANVLTSTDPTAGARAWRSFPLDPGNAPLIAVDCPSARLCVAIDRFRNVMTSEDPTAGPQTWSSIHIAGDTILVTLACASPSLCLIGDFHNVLYASTAPTAGAATWHAVGVLGVDAVECPSENRCVANGYLTLPVTDDPLAGTDGWTEQQLPGSLSLSGLSCPTVTFCAAVNGGLRNAVVGHGPPPMGTLEVTVYGEGAGSVTGPGVACRARCSVRHPRGDAIALSPEPAPGSVFAGWGGACAGTAPCEPVVGKSTTITADFALAPSSPGFDLRVSIGGQGRVVGGDIACPPDCRTSRPPQTTATLTVKPSAGWRFVRWGGACGGRGRCRLTATANQAVSAMFARPQATPARARIMHATLDADRGSARFAFGTSRAGARTRCALVRLRGGRRPPAPRFAACRSPKSYAHLAPGRYVFTVRPAGAGGVPARRSFALR